MASVNKVILLGRLGKDPELRYTQNNKPVTTFSLATSERWTDKASGEKKESTEWHRIVVWGNQAESCAKFLSKGSQAYVEGRLSTRTWTDKEDREQRTTEINATNVVFLGSGGGSSGGGGGGGGGRDHKPAEVPDESDFDIDLDSVPF